MGGQLLHLKIGLLFLFSLVFIILSACGTSSSRTARNVSATGPEGQSSVPALDPERVAQGEPLYIQYCAECHGPKGEGQPDWKTPLEDGSYPSPPHDATGHTWHHPDGLLVDIIANGSDFRESKMPVFGEQLTNEEILAILEYIKTWWGPEERAFQWQVTQQAQQ